MLGGRIDLTEGAVDLALRGDNLLLVNQRDLRVRADTDVTLRGRRDELELAGSMRVTDATYTEEMDVIEIAVDALKDKNKGEPAPFILFSLPGPPLSTMRLDIDLQSDETIHVDNYLLQGTASASIRLRGTGALPQPEGRVFVRNALVRLNVGLVKADRVQLSFPPQSPFEPKVKVGELRTYLTPGLDEHLTVHFDREIPDLTGPMTAELRLHKRWHLFAERDQYEQFNGGILWRLRFR